MTTGGYEIEILSHSIQNPANERGELDGLRILCADLIEGVDQEKHQWITTKEGGYDVYGDGLDHHSIFVQHGTVSEAVRRLNEAGYATDEDASEEDTSEEEGE